MSLLDFYKSNLPIQKPAADDYTLLPFTHSMYVGIDAEGTLAVILKSASGNRCPLMQKTKLLSVECNIVITHDLSGEKETITAHVVKCYSPIEKEKDLFLELIDALLVNKTYTDEEIMEAFRTLINFFADRREPSDGELIGLYAELCTILSFNDSFPMAKYWQSVDRMKFDFSVSDKLKIEVKATTKAFRTHHFRHEQLVADMFDIFIVSYMLRYDDEGVSLFEIINQAKPLLQDNPRKLCRVNLVLKNVSQERLSGLRFSPEYTAAKQQIFNAANIPKFDQYTPDGVANAEYDCSLENISSISRTDFINAIINAAQEDSTDGET